MRKSIPVSLLVFAIATGANAQTEEQRSTLNDQQEVAVTIYNNNLALIKDQRKIQLKSGVSSLAFRDVSANMRPETAFAAQHYIARQLVGARAEF